MVYDVEDIPAPESTKCIECGISIPAGDLCQESRWMDEQEEQLQYTCSTCAEIRTVFSCGETQPFGGMWDVLSESMDDLKMAGDCWDSLTAPAKAKLLEKWRQWKGLTV
jgi:hypothetical protein